MVYKAGRFWGAEDGSETSCVLLAWKQKTPAAERPRFTVGEVDESGLKLCKANGPETRRTPPWDPWVEGG